jgi:hypothetical protein
MRKPAKSVAGKTAKRQTRRSPPLAVVHIFARYTGGAGPQLRELGTAALDVDALLDLAETLRIQRRNS